MYSFWFTFPRWKSAVRDLFLITRSISLNVFQVYAWVRFYFCFTRIGIYCIQEPISQKYVPSFFIQKRLFLEMQIIRNAHALKISRFCVNILVINVLLILVINASHQVHANGTFKCKTLFELFWWKFVLMKVLLTFLIYIKQIAWNAV